jgi:small nuclear ribonucleoprotein (snRNP)-like protein
MKEEDKAQVGLEKFLNSVVVISAKDGRKFRGRLTQYDEYMNLVLEDVEEFSGEEQAVKHKLVLIKGGNVSAIST